MDFERDFEMRGDGVRVDDGSVFPGRGREGEENERGRSGGS